MQESSMSRGALAATAMAVLVLAACASGAIEPAATAAPAPAGTAAQGQLQLLLATSDLAVEDSRFAFGLLGPDGGLIEAATVETTFFRLQGQTAQATQESPAIYRALVFEQPHVHSTGETHIHREARGIYVADGVRFDAPGTWGVQARVSGVPNGPFVVNGTFPVREKSATPAIGSPAPASRQKTARDVTDLKEISSREPPIPAMYQRTIAEAVSSGRPSLIAFSTPAYCRSRVCGPVLEAAVSLLPAYQDRIEFIHVEPYDLATVRVKGTFELVAASSEWGLPSEPWTFLVDARGRLAAKYEGIVTPEELEAAFRRVLESP